METIEHSDQARTPTIAGAGLLFMRPLASVRNIQSFQCLDAKWIGECAQVVWAHVL